MINTKELAAFLREQSETCGDHFWIAAHELERQKSRIEELERKAGATLVRYMIGQRVILNLSEIGTVVAPENKAMPNTGDDVWVYSPSRGYASRYSACNIQPLPGGQL